MIAANKPTSVATAMGYLDTTRQAKKTRRYRRLPRSTPSLPPSPVSPSGDDFDDINDEGEPPSILYETCPHIRNSSCRPYRALSSLSRKGDEYVLVAIWDNYIHYEPMPSRTSAAYIQTYTAMIAVFKSVGRNPTF